ncbi:MAG: hypothetical protein ISS47_06530 [Candidatus Omnitrophica bacterium]|nr:hypothetical protein [Candidatus Omnitrophota bacterium]
MNSRTDNTNLSLKQEHEAAISKNYKWILKNEKPSLIDVRTGIEHDHNKIDTKILVYEDRVSGWFLNIAECLKNDNEAGFVILQIAVTYIEGNQQLREGKSSKRNSENFFIKGMRRIFEKEDVPEAVISHFYEQVRCGLFHDGMTGDHVFISSSRQEAVRIINNVIYINSHKFLDKIKEDFQNYVSDLRNNKDLRKNFDKMFYFGEYPK